MLEEVRSLSLHAVGVDLTIQCAERFYGIVSGPGEQDDEQDESIGDIERSIQKEIASMDKKHQHTKLIAPVRLDLQCVLFFKIQPSIDPVDFVYRICKEIVSTPGIRRMRYINRLTPMTLMGKATEKGLEEIGKTVLGQHFNLRVDPEQVVEDEGNRGRIIESQSIPAQSVSVAVSNLLFDPSTALVAATSRSRKFLTTSNTNMGRSMQSGRLLAITIL
jgi:tRNA acetyltransferase TAN1